MSQPVSSLPSEGPVASSAPALSYEAAPAQPLRFILNIGPPSSGVQPCAVGQATGPCSEIGCKATKYARECHHRRCKKHCLLQATPCGFKAHDKLRRALAIPATPAVHDPFALARPEAIIPTTQLQPASLPSSSNAANSLSLGDSIHDGIAPATFRAVMPELMRKRWDERAQSLLDKKRAEEVRRQNMVVLDHSISVIVWAKDGEQPLSFSVQGIPTWPTFILSAQEHIMSRLGLTGANSIQRFVLTSRFWHHEAVNSVVLVRSHERLLYRLDGVTTCPDFQHVCDGAASSKSQARLYSRSFAAANVAMSEASSSYSMASLISSTSGLSLDSAATHIRSPEPRPLSPSMVPDCSSLEPSGTPAGPQSQPHASDSNTGAAAVASTADTYDLLWQQGIVYTPPLIKKPWPAGIYARDMAMAFVLIGESANHDTVSARFEAVFQGRPYKYATYQAQRTAWFKSTEEERRGAMEHPRTREGLWTALRSQLSGWKQIPSHKRQ
ncbi:hypothetical protein FKP32DRAFT_1581039 [Trametes sanguinea]|nr:hypothetical protein FKP32DRAFT_1581039 [Trametes sanguinea]